MNQDRKKACWLAISMGIFTAILFSDCKKKEPSMKTGLESSKELPSDFVDFYAKFHSDSVYQLAHIQFPLEGYPSNADSAVMASRSFHWMADTWVIHNMQAFNDSLFTRQFDVSMPGVVNETIYQKNTPFGMFRRFFKRDNEWALIFYSAMNPMKEQ